jgi:SAM-dependent methyltransferase
MKILNLGCGTKTCSHSDVINMDWSIYLRLRRNPLMRRVIPLFLRGQRKDRFMTLPANIVVHDISKGLPFPVNSIDVVYHSHLLEHLDRSAAPGFLSEVRRVLKPGGIQRIVVPDLEKLCTAYLSHLDHCGYHLEEIESHDNYVAALLEQCVRREAFGSSQQPRFRRWLENRILGDARQRGETHQWMYDRANLSALLRRAGFHDIIALGSDGSRIPDWPIYGLDRDDQGGEYKPGSLYIEAVK